MGYAYLDVPMTNEFLINLCGSEALGGEGKLFRPTSRDELDRVNITMIPEIFQKDAKGTYPVDFTKYTLYNGTVWTSPNTYCVGFPKDFPKDEQKETVWGTYPCPFELMHQACGLEESPITMEEMRNVYMGDGITRVPTGASMISHAATNTTPSSASFPVKTEENSPSQKNNQSDLKDSIDYRLST